jgi:hypothetical protein
VAFAPTWDMMHRPMLNSRLPPGSLPKVGRRLPPASLVLALAIGACATFAAPANVRVMRTAAGQRSVQEMGTNLKLSRWEITLNHEGLKRGYFVVMSDIQWHELWPTVDADKVPLLPRDIDFTREMLVVSSPLSADIIGSEVKSAILNDREAHVYVTESELGAECPPNPDAASKSYDLVRVPRVEDKPVTFHVDTELGEPCGKPPDATIACRPDHSTVPLVEKLSVEPATKVACQVAELRASHPVFDLTWTWDSMPPGSAAKIDVAHGGRAVTFVPEVFGTYRLLLEVSDDLARKGSVTADVIVPPPAGPLSLQMVWTKMSPEDDPSTFPRIELHAFGVTPEAPKAGKPAPHGPEVPWGKVRDCSISAALATCTVKMAGATTVMTLAPASSKGFALAVHYIDDRVVGQPVVCVHSYRDGKLQADVCDPDKRDADTWWNVGVIDSRTGKTMEMLTQELTLAAAKASVPDGGTVDGAVEGGPSPEAGAASPPAP